MYKRTRIKVCGMAQAHQVKVAVNNGVDAIGVILHANSPRTISLDSALSIRAEIPAFVTMVGVFVNADREFIESSIQVLNLDLIQLHGDETNEFGTSLSRPFIKAIRANTAEQVNNDITRFPAAQALLLDPYVEGQHGGTGLVLNTSLWPQNQAQSLILAGGLSPDNVAQKVSALKPYAVDLNSGIEDSPGNKNSDLMQQAFDAVCKADNDI